MELGHIRKIVEQCLEPSDGIRQKGVKLIRMLAGPVEPLLASPHRASSLTSVCWVLFLAWTAAIIRRTPSLSVLVDGKKVTGKLFY
jgi:hypothetical protein